MFAYCIGRQADMSFHTEFFCITWEISLGISLRATMGRVLLAPQFLRVRFGRCVRLGRVC